MPYNDKWNLKSCQEGENIVTTPGGLQIQTLMAKPPCHAEWSSGAMISKRKQKYGLFEASIKAGDVSGLNNAFWLTTDDKYEIDIVEVHYPNDARMTLHNWDTSAGISVGFDSKSDENLTDAYHDYGVLWTPKELRWEVDGEPAAAITLHDGAVSEDAVIRFSTAVMTYAGPIPAHPEGHYMGIRSLRIYPP